MTPAPNKLITGLMLFAGVACIALAGCLSQEEKDERKAESKAAIARLEKESTVEAEQRKLLQAREAQALRWQEWGGVFIGIGVAYIVGAKFIDFPTGWGAVPLATGGVFFGLAFLAGELAIFIRNYGQGFIWALVIAAAIAGLVLIFDYFAKPRGLKSLFSFAARNPSSMEILKPKPTP